MEQEVADIVLFFGRFHPLILHLPIGFLVMAFILELVSRFTPNRQVGGAVGLVLLLGAVSAVFTAVLGYMLALAGGYNEELLAIHQWAGIGVALLAVAAWLVKRAQEREASDRLDRIYLSILSILMLVLTVAGHYGGSLTHGSGYLTQYMPDGMRAVAGLPPKEPRGFPEITNIEEAMVYRDIVNPILDTRCNSCHNDSKKKGELQMHTRELLLEGGENGPVFVAGNAEESEMIRRIFLPETHDDHMPPDGKRPLTEAHKDLLEWWVASGAPFDKKVADIEVSEEVQLALNTLVDPQANMTPAEKLLASEVEPAGEELLAGLEERGIRIRAVAEGSNWLQADIPAGRSGDSLMTALAGVSEQLTWLDLGGTVTTDAGLEPVAGFANLTRLHLQNTGISDAGLAHLAGLSHLEYLNLYGTGVTDEGIQQLAPLENLANLYLWQTEVTPEGISRLTGQVPGLKVHRGVTDTTNVAAALPE